MNNGIFSGSGAPLSLDRPYIGESVNLYNKNNKIITPDGKVFLRHGYLDDIASYSAEIKNNYTINHLVTDNALTSPSQPTSYTSPSYWPSLVKVGTSSPRYYFINESKIQSTTSLSSPSWADSTGLSYFGVGDYAVASDHLITYGWNSNTGYEGSAFRTSDGQRNYYISTSSSIQRMWASNGTQAIGTRYLYPGAPDSNYVIETFSTGQGGFYTITPTTSDSSTATAANLVWSIPGSCWIFFDASCRIYTSTNVANYSIASSWTRRTTPTALTNIYPVNSWMQLMNRELCVTNNTATVIIFRQNSGSQPWWLLRTTNGTDFTASTFSSLGIDVGSSGTIRIANVNNRYYIYNMTRDPYQPSQPLMWESADSGNTWTPIYLNLLLNGLAGRYPVSHLTYFDNKFYILSYPIERFASISGSLVGNYVGVDSSKVSTYIRVK